jgi:hypothetical protein
MESTAIVAQLGEQMKQFKSEYTALLNTANEEKKEAQRIAAEHAVKVKELNDALIAKDATIGQIQEAVKELKAKSGHAGAGVMMPVTSVEDLIAKSFETEKAQEILKNAAVGQAWFTDKRAFRAPMKSKAAGLITISAPGGTGGNVTGSTVVGVPSWSDQIWGRGYDDIHFRDIFRTIESQTGSFFFYRSTLAVGEGSVDYTYGPGADKNKIDKDLELQNVYARYLAGVVDIAKESLTDMPALQSYLNEELVEDYLTAEDKKMFAALLAAATGVNTVPGTATNAIEKIIYLLANQKRSRFRADRIIIGPEKEAEILVTKPNDYSLPNVVAITPNGDIRIKGIPLISVNTDQLSSNQVLIGDSRKAGILQVAGEGLKLELFDRHDKAVYNNIVTMRVEARVAPVIFRPEAFIKATI